MPGGREEILIVKLAALGDIATASTVLSRLRAERPTARVTWVVGRSGAGLVRLFDGVDEVIEVDDRELFRGSRVQQAVALLKVWRKLIRRRYDLAVVAHSDPRYRWVVLPIGRARIRMFSAITGRTNPIPGRFFGDEVARLLDVPGAPHYRSTGFELANLRVRAQGVSLPADVMAHGALDVAIAPGGARNLLRDDPLRRWPTGHYAALSRTLIAEGYRVGIVGDAGDAWVRPAFDGVAVIDLIGRLDIPQTLRVLADADVVIAHDTGPLHFARLVRARIVALFGPTTPRQVIGNPDGVTVLWGGADLPCRPCYDGREFPPCARNLCLEEVSVEAVAAAARAALAESALTA